MDGEAGIPQLVKVLSKRLNVSDADWQIGHSKIFLRRELSKKLERLAKLRVHAAARTLGRFGKSVVEHRLSSLLVTWVKFRLFMIKKRRAAGAASKISSGYRMNKQLKAFRATKFAIIKIQSLQRRRSAVKVAGKLRDPLGDMTYGELKQLLKSEKTRMENAVNTKNFRLAAEIESKM
jgi:myosin heavy subunit